MSEIEKNLECELCELARFSATPQQGCTRLPFSKETREAAEYIKQCMKEKGLTTYEDAVGNIFGVYHGKNAALPCIMSGSHYDSVSYGGNFDGIAGVVAAIETAANLKRQGVVLERDFVVAAFMDEEGCRFGTGYFGSRCMLGQMTVEECRKYKDSEGISVYEAMQQYGLVPEHIPQAAWETKRIGAFFEIHIEQGPVLEQKKAQIGIVDGIVGIRRYNVKVKGRADHAGTTPMHMRKDAVSAAARLIVKIEALAAGSEGNMVATVGKVLVSPGAVNIIAREVEFSIDVRSMKEELLDQMETELRTAFEKEKKLHGMEIEMTGTLKASPAEMDKELVEQLMETGKELGCRLHQMQSGAGHDTLAIAGSIPAAMIFVPSKGGRSHCKEEETDCRDLEKAVELLTETVKKL